MRGLRNMVGATSPFSSSSLSIVMIAARSEFSLSQRRTSLNPIHILAAYVQSRSLEMPRRLELRRFRETNARGKIHSKNWFTGFTCEVEVSDGVCYVENSRQFGLSFQKTLLLIYEKFIEILLKFTSIKTKKISIASPIAHTHWYRDTTRHTHRHLVTQTEVRRRCFSLRRTMNRWKSIEHVQSKRDQASIWNRENVARLFTRQVRPVPKQLSFLIFSGFSKFLSSAVLKISLKNIHFDRYSNRPHGATVCSEHTPPEKLRHSEFATIFPPVETRHLCDSRQSIARRV